MGFAEDLRPATSGQRPEFMQPGFASMCSQDWRWRTWLHQNEARSLMAQASNNHEKRTKIAQCVQAQF